MKNEPVRIAVIIGSTRPNRFSDKPAEWITGLAKKSEGVELEVLDLRDFPMPFFSETATPSTKKESYSEPSVSRWTEKIARADGFIVVTPEYNHGPSAVLKNAFDYVSQEWNNKPIAFVSYGSVGGARAVEQMRLVAVELQMAPIRHAVYITSPWFLVDEQGRLKAGVLDQYASAAEAMISQLMWWTRALKSARLSS